MGIGFELRVESVNAGNIRRFYRDVVARKAWYRIQTDAGVRATASVSVYLELQAHT